MHEKKNQVRTCYIIQFYSKMQIVRSYLCHIFYCYISCYLACHISMKVFKNQPSKICGRQPLKHLKGYGLLYLPQFLLGPFFEYLVSYIIAWCFPHIDILEDFKSIIFENSWVQRDSNTYPFNLFHATGFFLYPLKTSEDLWLSYIFRAYRKRTLTWNGLTSKLDRSSHRRCWIKKLFLKISQYSQETTYAGVTFFWIMQNF